MSRSNPDMDGRINGMILAHAGIALEGAALEDDTDLHLLGMNSYASVQLMLALEKVFEIRFPDEMLKRSTFRSPATIRTAVMTLLRRPDA